MQRPGSILGLNPFEQRPESAGKNLGIFPSELLPLVFLRLCAVGKKCLFKARFTCFSDGKAGDTPGSRLCCFGLAVSPRGPAGIGKLKELPGHR